MLSGEEPRQEDSAQRLSAPARRAGVLGSPIAHSLSPVLHAAAYRCLHLEGWTYDAHEVAADELAGFVAGLDGSWAGLSLTMPLKEAALEVADEASELASDLGVANTLVRLPAGGWRADNTDVYGVLASLREVGASALEQAGGRAVVLGSGATARSVLAALADLGVREVDLVVRADARPATLALADRLGLEVRVHRDPGAPGDTDGTVGTDGTDGADSAGVVAGAALVVNTAPAGGSDALAGRVAQQPSTMRQVLLDVVYDGWPTPLARVFEQRGASVAGGLDLLVHQAARQVLLMTGLEPPVGPMRAAGLAALAGG